MQIITLAEAKAAGLKRFYTGVPCKNGHMAERYVCGDRPCVRCLAEQNARSLAKLHGGKRPQTDAQRAKAKAYAARRYQENRAEVLAAVKARHAADPTAGRARVKAWKQANPDRYKASGQAYRRKASIRRVAEAKKWRAENLDRARAITRASNAARYARLRHCFPAWADKAAIKRVYDEAARRSAETGIPHEVDHFYPICGKNVCGLHVAGNLRVITRNENRRKHTHVWEHDPCGFGDSVCSAA